MIGLGQPDPRGWIAFDSLPDDLQRAEDSTAAADFDKTRQWIHTFDRAATETEKWLLLFLGHGQAHDDGTVSLPPDLTTHVRFRTSSVRNRTWPELETTTTTPGGAQV